MNSTVFMWENISLVRTIEEGFLSSLLSGGKIATQMLLLRLCSRRIYIRRAGSKLWGDTVFVYYIFIIYWLVFHQMFCIILANEIINKIIKTVLKLEIQIYTESISPKQNDDCLPCFLYQSFFYGQNRHLIEKVLLSLVITATCLKNRALSLKTPIALSPRTSHSGAIYVEKVLETDIWIVHFVWVSYYLHFSLLINKSIQLNIIN